MIWDFFKLFFPFSNLTNKKREKSKAAKRRKEQRRYKHDLIPGGISKSLIRMQNRRRSMRIRAPIKQRRNNRSSGVWCKEQPRSSNVARCIPQKSTMGLFSNPSVYRTKNNNAKQSIVRRPTRRARRNSRQPTRRVKRKESRSRKYKRTRTKSKKYETYLRKIRRPGRRIGKQVGRNMKYPAETEHLKNIRVKRYRRYNLGENDRYLTARLPDRSPRHERECMISQNRTSFRKKTERSEDSDYEDPFSINRSRGRQPNQQRKQKSRRRARSRPRGEPKRRLYYFRQRLPRLRSGKDY